MLSTQKSVTVGSGGFIDTPNQRLAIRMLRSTPEELAETVVTFRNGARYAWGCG
ncbi:MAG: hypothetical protein R3C02_03220 [Planctomycetaceae bacterium]